MASDSKLRLHGVSALHDFGTLVVDVDRLMGLRCSRFAIEPAVTDA